METDSKIILDSGAMNRTIARLSHEIIERNADAEEICLIGIHRRGVPLARRIADNIRLFSNVRVELGEIDITLYRDDLRSGGAHAEIWETRLDFPIREKTVVLVDDVISTGRTARAAMEAVINQGRPACIQLAVLIDRGHRELPIRGDFIGKSLPTSKKEFIMVRLPEIDGKNDVLLCKPKQTEEYSGASD